MIHAITGFFRRRPHFVPGVIAAVMLFATVGKWPYDYYLVLRWVVCAAAVFVAYQGWTFRKPWASWLFGTVAVLFNPILPVHFQRATWQVIDLAAAAAFVLVAAALAGPYKEHKP